VEIYLRLSDRGTWEVFVFLLKSDGDRDFRRAQRGLFFFCSRGGGCSFLVEGGEGKIGIDRRHVGLEEGTWKRHVYWKRVCGGGGREKGGKKGGENKVETLSSRRALNGLVLG